MSPDAGRAIVVGAGSAGLASAALLRQAGFAVTLYEAGALVGERWHRRYASLRLNTLRALSGLPGQPIPRAEGDWVSGGGFARYLVSYAAHHRLEVRTGTAVTGVTRTGATRTGATRTGGQWLVGTADGEIPADVVVVATGHADQPTWPAWPNRHAFPGPVLHSSEYQRPAPFAGRRVLVVGSGNSATEIATDLVGHAAEVWLSVRGAPLLVPTSQYGVATHRVSVLGRWLPDAFWDVASRCAHWSRYRDLARYGLPVPATGSHTTFRRRHMAPVAERGFAAAVRRGAITVVPATVDVGPAGARLADGRVLRPDVVIAATGFRPNFAALLGHLDVLDPAGRPLAWGAPLPDAPGLFVVGRPSLQGDLWEHGREARRVSVAARGHVAAARAATLLSPATAGPARVDPPGRVTGTERSIEEEGARS